MGSSRVKSQRQMLTETKKSLKVATLDCATNETAVVLSEDGTFALFFPEGYLASQVSPSPGISYPRQKKAV